MNVEYQKNEHLSMYIVSKIEWDFSIIIVVATFYCFWCNIGMGKESASILFKSTPLPSPTYTLFFFLLLFTVSMPTFFRINSPISFIELQYKRRKKKKKVVMAGERMNQKDHIKDHSDEKTKSSMIKRTTS